VEDVCELFWVLSCVDALYFLWVEVSSKHSRGLAI
jgi:hypothetical protein